MNDEENTTTPASRPLGFLLRTVDRLIEREFERAFADEGVTRRDWRILNVLGGDVEAPGLTEHLERRSKKLRGLVDRGWVTETEGSWTLTDQGRAAKERLGAAVAGIRSKVAGSVADEDFATTVRSLETIARELGWDENEPVFSRGRRRGFGRSGFGRNFGPGFHPGSGPDVHPGFGPAFGHGQPGFGPGFGHGRPGFRPGFAYGRPGFGPAEHANGDLHAEFDPGAGFTAPRHGHHGAHGRHRHGDRRAQRAYESGFDAGFTRGREEHNV